MSMVVFLLVALLLKSMGVIDELYIKVCVAVEEYWSWGVHYIYTKSKLVCSLSELWREDITSAFEQPDT